MKAWLMTVELGVTALPLFGANGVQAQTPYVLGVWQLDPQASDVPEFIALQSETRVYSLRDDGYLVVLVVRAGNGGADFIQVAARSDGTDYPEYRSQSLAEFAINGTATPFTYSETVVDDYAVHVIGKNNGQVATRGTRRVSEDGQTMTLDVTIIQGEQQLPIVLVFNRL